MYLSCHNWGDRLLLVLPSKNDLLLEVPYDPLKSEIKRQKLIECILTRNSKQYPGKAYTKVEIKKLSTEEVNKFFSNYEVKL